jgi:hypothetical protein
VLCSPGGLADSLFENGSTTGQHRQVADRGFVSDVFGGSRSSHMVAAVFFLWLSALHYC